MTNGSAWSAGKLVLTADDYEATIRRDRPLTNEWLHQALLLQLIEPCRRHRARLGRRQLLGLQNLNLLTVDRFECNPNAAHSRGLLRLTMETERSKFIACRDRGVLAADHGRREHRLADAPYFETPVQLIWRKRRWRCRE